MVDKIIDISRTEMLKNPQMTDELIEQSISMVRKSFLPFTIGGVIIGLGFFGAIGSLIGAAVAKKKPADPFSDMQASMQDSQATE